MSCDFLRNQIYNGGLFCHLYSRRLTLTFSTILCINLLNPQMRSLIYNFLLSFYTSFTRMSRTPPERASVTVAPTKFPSASVS